MVDNNLGRATGEVRINYDGRGLREAQADMAGTAAEAAALDAAMGRVNRTFDDNQRKTSASAEEIVRARGEVEELARTYKRAQDEYNRVKERLGEAEQKWRDVRADDASDLRTLAEAQREFNEHLRQAERAESVAADALENLRVKKAALNLELERFNRNHIEATRGFRNMAREAERLGESLESVTEKLAGVARILGQAGLFGLFGGAAMGSLFASGAGALNLLAGAMSVVVEVAQDFVGVMALAPAAINGAVLAFGSLAVAFHGVGEALSSIGDPAKFIASIQDLSPTMQQVMLTVQSFTSAMRGARDQVQESFATQFAADIQPLITTWLPQLMRAGQAIATEWGQAFHQVFQFFQTPEAQQGFQTFVNNLVTGFQAARAAIQPLLSAWNTLATVGSQVFPRLGQAIATVANEFNAWIQRSAQSGQLLDFINRALDGITNMGRIVRDVALGINNMFEIFRGGGGSTLATLTQISAEFRAWTESFRGQQSIANFFNLIQAAAQAVRPQIHLLGEAIAVISGTLTRLGIAIQPGLNSFFTSFVEALRNLSPYIIQMAPAINEFLTAFGQTLLQIVNSLGPRLPLFFQDMADAFVQILQLLPPVVDVFARLVDHMTPTQIEGLLGVVGALKLMSATLPGITNGIRLLNIAMDAGPTGKLIAAIGLLVTGAILLATHWDTVREKTNELTSKFGGLHGILDGLKRAWDAVTGAVSNFFSTLGGQISGGWDVVVTSFGELKDKIIDWWNDIDWAAMGRSLVQKLADGIGSAKDLVVDSMKNIMGGTKEPVPGSRAKVGPWSTISPEEAGARMVTQYAAGMSSGRPAVDSAASSIASSSSGIGGGGGGAGFGSTQFTSAGQAGTSGRDFTQGRSGFDQWANFVTKDLTAWNNILRQGWDLFSSISGIVTDTIRVTANLWNGGNNPLTQPGGLMGPPQAAGQQSVFGVPNKPIPGIAPDQYGRTLAGAGDLQPQQQVPGVPNKRPGQPGFIGPVAAPAPAPAPTPPASTTGAAAPTGSGPFVSSRAAIPPLPPIPGERPGTGGTDTGQQMPASPTGGGTPGAFSVPLVQNPDGTWGSPDPEWQKLITRESGGSLTVPNTHDSNFIAGHPSLGLFQITQPTWEANGGLALAPSPDKASAAQQGQVAANILRRNPSGSDWGLDKYAGREDAGKLLAALRPGGAVPASTAGAAAPQFPGAVPESQIPPQVDQSSRGLPTTPRSRPADLFLAHTQEGKGSAQDLVNTMLSPEYKAAVGNFSYNYYIDPDTGQVITGVDPSQGSIGTGGVNQRAINAVIAGSQASWSREEWLRHMPALQSFARLAAESGVPLVNIEGNTDPNASGIGGHDWATGAGFKTDDHSDPGPNFPWDVVMGMAQAYKAGTPPGEQPARTAGGAIPQVPGLPAGPTTSLGGFNIPGSARPYIGAALGGGLTYAAGTAIRNRIVAPISDRIARLGLERYDAATRLDIVRGMSPAELDAAGIRTLGDAERLITFGESTAPPEAFTGMNVDMGAALNSADPERFANMPIGEQRQFAGAIQDVMRQPGGIRGEGPMAPRNPAATVVGQEGPSVAGRAPATGVRGALGIGGRVLGGALSLANAGLTSYGIVSESVEERQRREIAQGHSAINQGSVLGIPANQYIATTPSGTGSAVESRITPADQANLDRRRAEGTTQPTATDQGPRPGAQAERRGGRSSEVRYVPEANGWVDSAGNVFSTRDRQYGPSGRFSDGKLTATGSTPVHVTNPQQLPGGTASPPVVTRAVAPTANERPLRPGDPGFIGPVAPAPRTQTPGRDQGPRPGAQAERREQLPGVGEGLAPGANTAAEQQGDASNRPVPKKDTRSPMTKFTDTMSSVGSIAGDAFTVFQDIIESIGAAANITDTLVRGFQNTESVVNFIQQFQTFIKTAADVAKLVGDVGGMVGGMGGGDPTGMASAIGGAISAISGIVQSALEATNAAISLGIDIYHEVGKYAGFIFGEFLGGAATGPLGGNVRMLLNTRTNQLQTYSEDNPANKNTFDVPLWQRSYQQQQTPPSLPPQVNFYAGPGQTPQQFMSDSMFAATVGSAAVASVAGQD